MRLAACGVAVVLAMGALGACNDRTSSVLGQAQAGDSKGYVGGDGSVETLTPSERKAAISLDGTTVTGSSWSLAADGSGRVVVVNVWGAWCPPCVAEIPHLQSAWAGYQKANAPVTFIGVDTRDSTATAAGFLEANGVTYPSINDQASQGKPLLQLSAVATATPTTLVLDRQGRVAARVLGATTEKTITDLVDAVVAEKS